MLKKKIKLYLKVCIFINIVYHLEEINYFNTAGFRLKRLFLNLLYFLCLNSLPGLLIYFVNKKYADDDIIVSIGATNTIINLTLWPFVLGFSSVIEILGSQAYGSNKFYLLGCYINRTRVLAYIIFLFITIIIIFLEGFYYQMMGFDQKITKNIKLIMIFRILASFFDLEYNIMIRYLQITGNSLVGMILCFSTFCSFPFYCYLFINFADLHCIGIGLSYLCLSTTNLIPLWIYILWAKPNEDSIFFFNKHSFEGLSKILQLSLILFLIMILDLLNTEIMMLFANNYDKSSYVSFILAISLYYFFNSLHLSYNVISCVIISYYVGKNDVESVRKMIFYLFIDATIIGLIIFLFSILLRNEIASLLTSDQKIISNVGSLLVFFFMINVVENFMAILVSTMKSIQRLLMSVLLEIILIIIYIIVVYLLGKYTDLGIKTIPISNFILNFLSIILYGSILKLINWKKDFTENKEELEMDEIGVEDDKKDK